MRKTSQIPQASSNEASDLWSHWLLNARHAGDSSHAAQIQKQLNGMRDRVLAGARLVPAMTLVDVGAGDGLIALGALEQFAGRLKVVITDISAPLLGEAQAAAMRLGFQHSCQFIQTPAETLTGIPDDTADALTTRAALAYVPDKIAAARQFFRVLKPEGRLSICEPIFQDAAAKLAALGLALQNLPNSPATNLARLTHRCRTAQIPSTAAEIQKHPLTNFTERDLVALFQMAGFIEIHMELHIDLNYGVPMNWPTFLHQSPFPGALSLFEAMTATLNREEQQQLEAHLRPKVESGQVTTRECVAYLTALKPSEAKHHGAP